MRYYRGKLMKDYKPKVRTTCVPTFCRCLMNSRVELRVVGGVAYDKDGDKRIIYKSRKRRNGNV